jgi:D-3-phosphoglycerate dehydrogenase
MPGVLSAINSELSLHNINISGQYLKTKDEIGYVVLDIDNEASGKVADLLGKVKGTIKVRVLY